MQRLHYLKDVRPSTLYPALIAAVPALAPVVGASGLPEAVFQVEVTPAEVWITVPDTVVSAAVDAVVTAHDPTSLSAVEQTAQTDLADLAAFPTRTQVTAALTAIDADLLTLGGALTLAQAGPILKRTVTNQRAIIRALAALVRRQGT